MFVIALSKYDGQILRFANNQQIFEGVTPCAQSKQFLQSLITSTIIDLVDEEEENNLSNREIIVEDEESHNDGFTSFKDCANMIAQSCELKVADIEGEYDNAQYIPELVPLIVNLMKLFPCWSMIMVESFGFGEKIASNSRVESHFNQIKHRVFKNDILPLRVDSFIEKLLNYYRGDQLLIQTDFLNEKNNVFIYIIK